ncbi:MAG TPA: dipeptidase [Longimicrobiaceae bacterium]|nr:dipeptidase [Longimicrobiaceae bacterium]
MRVSLPISAFLMATALPLVLPPAPLDAQARDPYLARAERVLRSTPLVDGHNDLPWRIREDSLHPGDVDAYDLRTTAPGMTDLERLRAGRVGAQFWSVFIPGERTAPDYAPNGRVTSTPGYARVQLEQIDIARRIVEKYPERFAWANTPAEIRRVFRQGKVGSLLGLEGGHAIENSLGALRAYHDLGARYMTLTHNVTLDWADAATDTARHGGLTPFGREVVREMNRLGMLVDLSHVSPATMSDALETTEVPVIFSHSSARALVDHPRNVPDSILARLKQNGGVVMVTFVPLFISQEVANHAARRDRVVADLRQRYPSDAAAVRRELEAWRVANPSPRATLAQVADHIEHVRRVAGVDHVGIGGDFDGISEVVVGLEDVSTYPALFAELARRGWSDAELRKLAGENALRVLGEAQRVAQRLQRERGPSYRTIQELDGAARR